MRVLHLGKYYPPYRGGIEQFLGDLLPALREEGVEPAALVHAHFRPEREMRPFPVWRVPTYGQWLYAPVSPAFPLWLKEMMGTFRPDLLHLHLPNVSPFWALAVPAARRLPWIVHWHADVVPSQLDLRLRLGYWAYRPLEQRLLRRAERIIVTSSPYRDSSVALKPWLEKTEVVPLGLDPSRLSGPDLCSCLWAEKQWGEEDRLRLLCIGRLTYYKGHRVLFQALSQIEGIKLLCAGGGELAGELANQIRRHGLEAKAELLGEVSDAYRNALLASCDVLVLPSVERTEAFGLVLLEAMAYGKPAIAACIPGSGIGWVVEDGQTGWLVPPQDPGALAERIEFVRQHPKLRQRAGELGRQRFIQHFHIRACARQIAKLYQIVR